MVTKALLRRTLACTALLILAAFVPPCAQSAPQPPQNLVSRAGDRTTVLHWDSSKEPNVIRYRVYRSLDPNGPYAPQSHRFAALLSPSFADVQVTNGISYSYRVTAVDTALQESQPSSVITVTPRPFADDDQFLDYLQQTAFDYVWYEANPTNGLVRDRLGASAPCSIAAVGFGLSVITIAIDHGWITREQGRDRVLATVNTFWTQPQGPDPVGTIGHKGWFYHFLDMNTGLRYPPWKPELSSIDTALLLAGVLHAKQYFDEPHPDEAAIREAATAIFNRVDWNWMARNTDVLSMGWHPESGFLSATWKGYNEASILYLLAIGAQTNPLPSSAWTQWTTGYTWETNYGYAFVPFPPLFGHQYSQCWLDLRHTADDYMNRRGITYFENSRRATLAQRAYSIANPLHRTGYSQNVWGLTASDGPAGYAARGAPPPMNDDGTLAPTAPGASIPFAPEACLSTLRFLYDQFRTTIWTAYGFCDAFNLERNWWDNDVLGIDQAPIAIMIENYRTQRVWRLFMRNKEVQRGLERAGFVPLPFVSSQLSVAPQESAVSLTWNAVVGENYRVEYSPDLAGWFNSPVAPTLGAGTAEWIDAGPPATTTAPFSSDQRFYRVLQLSPP